MTVLSNAKFVAAALRETDPWLADLVDAESRWADYIEKRGERVAVYRDYEAGNHASNITSQMKSMLRIEPTTDGLEEFNDNYMRLIVEKMASRIRIASISTDQESDEDDEWLQKLLSRNRIKSIQARAARAAIRDGDSFVLIDPVKLNWGVEPAFDGETGMVAITDPLSNEVIWACKCWVQSDKAGSDQVAATVFHSGGISYFKGQPGSGMIEPNNVVFVPDAGDDGDAVQLDRGVYVNYKPWPLPSIPIVAFSNNLDAKTGNGESELRAVIPMQNVLNRLIHSMVMASEFAAFNVRYAVGVKIDDTKIVPGAALSFTLKDKNGNPLTELSDKQIEYLKSIQIGQFTGTDIKQYTEQITAIVKEISQTSQTPIYGITATGNLSGEALRQLEIGLIGKVRRFQHENEDALRQLIKITADIQTSFSRSPDAIDGLIDPPPVFSQVIVEWQSPEILDAKEEVRSLVDMRQKTPGLWSDDFYRVKIGALLGMSKRDITEYAGEGMPEPVEEGEDADEPEEGGDESGTEEDADQ